MKGSTDRGQGGGRESDQRVYKQVSGGRQTESRDHTQVSEDRLGGGEWQTYNGVYRETEEKKGREKASRSLRNRSLVSEDQKTVI